MINIRFFSAIILTLALWAGASASAPVASATIVTMPFENVSGRPEYNWIGESFATTLADLLDKPSLIAIRSDERNVAYKQEGLPPTAILTRATMIKIAERAGANLVVMGTYRITVEDARAEQAEAASQSGAPASNTDDKSGRRITITARLIDIREGRQVGREFTLGGNLLELQKLQGEVAYEILNRHNANHPFSRDQLVAQATQAPIGAYENYIKGTLTRDRDARIEFLGRAIKEFSDRTSRQYAPAVFELGRVYFDSGDYKEALRSLESVDSKDSRYDEAQFYVGVARDASGQTDKALESLKQLAPQLPLYEVYNNVGVLLIKKKQYAEAIENLKPAADAAPRDTDTLFNLGYAYFLAKDFTSAIAVLRKEIERRPSDGEAFYLLSKSLAAAGDQAGAAEAANQAKKLLPSFAQWETKGIPNVARIKTAFSKANYYRYKRDQDDRLTAQGATGSQAPQTDQLLESARNAFFAGRDEEALVVIRKLLETAPQNHEAHFLMGRVHERRGEFDRAVNALKAAVFWNPRLVGAHVLLGRIAVLKNDCAGAGASLNKSLQIDASDQDAQALKRLIEQKCK